MFKHKSSVLRSGLVLAAVALLPLTEAAAQIIPTPLYTPPPISRSCTAVAGSGVQALIIAGPVIGTTPDLTAPFPVTVPCPSPFTGTCSRWDYRWIYTGVNPSHAVLAVDADLKVLQAASGGQPPTVDPDTSVALITSISGDSSTSYGINKASEIGLRFNSNGSTFFGSFYTQAGIGIGTMTAGFAGGNRRAYCAIAGADNPGGDPLLTQAQTITGTVGGCTINWTLSPDGCVTGATTEPSTCTVINRSLVVNNQDVTTATCGTEIAGPFGSTETCRWNSFLRAITCVTVQ